MDLGEHNQFIENFVVVKDILPSFSKKKYKNFTIVI